MKVARTVRRELLCPKDFSMDISATLLIITAHALIMIFFMVIFETIDAINKDFLSFNLSFFSVHGKNSMPRNLSKRKNNESNSENENTDNDPNGIPEPDNKPKKEYDRVAIMKHVKSYIIESFMLFPEDAVPIDIKQKYISHLQLPKLTNTKFVLDSTTEEELAYIKKATTDKRGMYIFIFQDGTRFIGNFSYSLWHRVIGYIYPYILRYSSNEDFNNFLSPCITVK